MIKSISEVVACTLSEIKQMGGVQLEMTQSPDEVSENAQVNHCEVLREP